jgi:uncharacterized Zn finger protein (UPF0148 family)
MSTDDSFRTFPMPGRPVAERPYACCPRDGEPLVSTLEFYKAEFYCVVCGTKYGFLAPVGKAPTSELEARHAELRVQYETERAARQVAPMSPDPRNPKL